MAFIFTRDERGNWAAVPLSDRPLVLQSVLSSISIANNNDLVENAPAQVIRTESGFSRRHVLVWGDADAVRINGLPLPTGIHVLADRDELRIRGRGPLYFSKETFPVIETFEGKPPRVECGRCSKPVEVGSSVVYCPVCRVVYHETADFNCWTCVPACRHCGHPTAIGAGFQWTPQDASD